MKTHLQNLPAMYRSECCLGSCVLRATSHIEYLLFGGIPSLLSSGGKYGSAFVLFYGFQVSKLFSSLSSVAVCKTLSGAVKD